MLPDNQFDKLPLLKIVKDIEEHIKLVNPDEIFTHFEDDLNIDHFITSKAVTTATSTLPEQKILIFFISYNVFFRMEFLSSSNLFKPNIFMS